MAAPATAGELPGAEPQKQKHVHMVSICPSGETLIFSCHLLGETPALSQPGALRLALVSQREQLRDSALRGALTALCLGQFGLKSVFKFPPPPPIY